MPIPECRSRSSPPPNLATSLSTEISQSKVLDFVFTYLDALPIVNFLRMTSMYCLYLHTPLTTLALNMVPFQCQKMLLIDELIRIHSVIIVGHSVCGGAAASLKAAQAPGFVPKLPIITIDGEPVDSPLNRWLEPLTLLAYSLNLPDSGANSLEIVVKENIKAQVENLAKTETIVKAWSQGKKLFLHGWVYDLSTGLLKDLNISRSPPN